MNRLLLALFLTVVSMQAYAASETIPNLPAAGTILNSTPVPVWNGITTVQTTAGAIAALGASTSGSGIPGGLSTQPQFNNGGTFGGLNEYDVTAYGAKCDGVILEGGIQATSGSPVIWSGSTNGGTSIFYNFTSKDVGATITIVQESYINESAPTTTGFTSTISSVSGGKATLAGNVPFTTSNGYGNGLPGGSARFYHTDDSVAIQNALTAAASQETTPFYSGAKIQFPSGVCVAHNLVFYANEDFEGEGRNTTTLMLAANANTDLLISYGFYDYLNTPALNGDAGTSGVRFANMTFDGNAGSNTATGSGTPTGSGDLIRLWATNYSVYNVAFTFSPADGLLSANNFPAGAPFVANPTNPGAVTGSRLGGEAYPDFIYVFGNVGWGIVWDGPHDSIMGHVWGSDNGGGDLLIPVVTPYYNSGGFYLNYEHGYAEAVNVDYENYGGFTCDHCGGENATIINGPGASFISPLGPVQLGKPGGGQTPLGFHVIGGALSINNSYNVDEPSQDSVVDANVSAVTGTYQPGVSTNSSGIGYQGMNTALGPLTLHNCQSGTPSTCTDAIEMNVDTTGLFTLSGGSANPVPSTQSGFLTMTTSGSMEFGPGAVAAPSGVGADFHLFNTSANSSLTLPQGPTSSRPACSGATSGGLRFNTSTNLLEECNGLGTWLVIASGPVLSTGVPNAFTAGQSVVPVTIPLVTATYTPNLVLGNNFIINFPTSCSTGCTLANPLNFVPGQSGMIYLVQSGSGSDTISSYGSQFIFSGGTAPTLSTGANAIDVESYTTVTIGGSNYVLINPSLNFHN